MDTKKIIKNIVNFWKEYGDTEDYYECSYSQLSLYCKQKFYFNLDTFSIRYLKKEDCFDLENPRIQSVELQYLYILLCAVKSKEIFDLLNFILLPTDICSLKIENIISEIELIKNKFKSH